MIKFALLLTAYTFVALAMCAFIMANENSESFGSPSPISDVKSTQRGSIVEYIIWGLAVVFLILCIFLNRVSKPSVISKLLAETSEEKAPEAKKIEKISDERSTLPAPGVDMTAKPEADHLPKAKSEHEVHDITGAIIKPIIENATTTTTHEF